MSEEIRTVKVKIWGYPIGVKRVCLFSKYLNSPDDGQIFDSVFKSIGLKYSRMNCSVTVGRRSATVLEHCRRGLISYCRVDLFAVD